MLVLSIEGVDYAGKSLLISELSSQAKELGYEIITQAFPSHDSFGAKAREQIGSKDGCAVKAAHYLVKNFKEKSSEILDKDTDDKTIVLFDRYVATTYAHQGTVVEIESGEFLIPDYQIVLNLDHKTFLERKNERGVDWDDAETKKHSTVKGWERLNQRFKDGAELYSKWIGQTLYYDGNTEKADMAKEILELIAK